MHNSTVYKQSLASVLLEMDPTVCPTITTTTTTTTTLSRRIGKVVASHAAVARLSPAEVGLIYTMHVALRGTPMKVGSATSQLDLLSLTPLFAAGCG